MGKLILYWDRLRTSLWFVPALIVAGAVVLAFALIALEPVLGQKLLTQRWPHLFGAGAEGSRGLLSTIAGSMITVAGVTFSITVVALTLASSQYSPRILRNFMRDRLNQTVLGVFVGVFAYCLVILRTIRSGDDGVYVPALAVFVALLLALVAMAFLIIFIHHIASSIQAATIIEGAAKETLEAIDRMYPDDATERLPADEDFAATGAAAQRQLQDWRVLAARRSGSLQGIDTHALLDFARDEKVVIRLDVWVGDFVTRLAAVAALAGDGGQPLAPDAAERAECKLDAALTLGRQRTMQQDPAFGLRQIADVAMKALSPGINDTTTAITCIDYLGAILSRLAPRRMAYTWRGEAGRLLLISRGMDFTQALGLALDQIRQNAEGNVAIMVRLLGVLAILAQRCVNGTRREALRVQARLIDEAARRGVPTAHDRDQVQAALARFDAAMTAGPLQAART